MHLIIYLLVFSISGLMLVCNIIGLFLPEHSYFICNFPTLFLKTGSCLTLALLVFQLTGFYFVSARTKSFVLFVKVHNLQAVFCAQELVITFLREEN